jgi:hypothetical protein
MTHFTIELGAEVESNITGYKGVAISRSEHLNGCNRYYVQPKVETDGKYPDGCWLDENELVVTKPPKLEKKSPNKGGFMSKIR